MMAAKKTARPDRTFGEAYFQSVNKAPNETEAAGICRRVVKLRAQCLNKQLPVAVVAIDWVA